MQRLLTVFAFILNLAITGLVGNGIPGTLPNEVISAKYQTLVTPVGWAFSIWGIIFGSQFIFTVAQIIPSISGNDMVRDGVGYNFIGACLAQAGWGLIFGYELIEWSIVFMLIILFFLVRIVLAQNRVDHDDTHRYRDYWLLVFPFLIHCGWITAASLVNFNLVLVRFQASAFAQLLAALVSLAVLLVVGIVRIFDFAGMTSSDFVIPSVLAWAAWGIHAELGKPNDHIRATFDQSTIDLVRNVDGVVLCILMICICVRVILPASFFTRQLDLDGSERTPLRSSEH